MAEAVKVTLPLLSTLTVALTVKLDGVILVVPEEFFLLQEADTIDKNNKMNARDFILFLLQVCGAALRIGKSALHNVKEVEDLFKWFVTIRIMTEKRLPIAGYQPFVSFIIAI